MLGTWNLGTCSGERWVAGGHGTWNLGTSEPRNLGTSEPRLEAKFFETRLRCASKIFIYDLDLEPRRREHGTRADVS